MDMVPRGRLSVSEEGAPSSGARPYERDTPFRWCQPPPDTAGGTKTLRSPSCVDMTDVMMPFSVVFRGPATNRTVEQSSLNQRQIKIHDGAPLNPVAMPRDDTTRSMGVSADFMRSVQQVCAEQRFAPAAPLDVCHARRARVVSSRETKLTSSFLSAEHVGSEGALPSLCSRV